MKKVLLLMVVTAFAAACASTGPAGTWNYKVTGTPQGDYAGLMKIAKSDKGYSASLSADGGETPMNKFTYTKSDKKIQGDFDFSGVNIILIATQNEDVLKGTMSTSGMEWPFEAYRKKDKK